MKWSDMYRQVAPDLQFTEKDNENPDRQEPPGTARNRQDPNTVQEAMPKTNI